MSPDSLDHSLKIGINTYSKIQNCHFKTSFNSIFRHKESKKFHSTGPYVSLFQNQNLSFGLINQRNCILKFERNVCTQLEDKSTKQGHLCTQWK